MLPLRPPPLLLFLLPLAEEEGEEEYEAASIKDKDKLRPARAAAEINTAVISSGVSKTPSPGSYTTITMPPDGLTTRATLSAKRVKLTHTHSNDGAPLVSESERKVRKPRNDKKKMV